MTERRLDIDWLRILAVWLLFLFHVGKAYDTAPYYPVKAPDGSTLLNYMTGFIHVWHMPLFFFLAGWAVKGSLERKGTKDFIIGRFLRLGLPFVFLVLIFCPPIRYVHALTAQNYEGSFLNFVPMFFSSLTYFSWSHGWFLLYLLTFTLLYLPLFRWAQRREFSLRRKRWLFLPPLLLVLIQLVLRPIWPGYQNLYNDWANVTYYSTFFLLGDLFSRSPEYETWLLKTRRFWMFAAWGSVLLLLVLDLSSGWSWMTRSAFALASYSWVLAMLAWARQWAASWTRGHRFWVKAAFPVYILHQAMIVIPGYWIAFRTDWPLALRFGLSLLTSILLTMVVYGALVKPFRPVRFLFGER